MMEIDQFGIVTFNSTHHAIKGESAFKSSNMAFKTIPTPREITLSCGLSIRFDLNDLEKVKNLVEDGDLSIKGIYKYIRDENGSRLEKIL
jgi:hypothetical protein